MDIAISCPQCGRRFQLPETFLGKKARCQTCGTIFRTARDEDAYEDRAKPAEKARRTPPQTVEGLRPEKKVGVAPAASASAHWGTADSATKPRIHLKIKNDPDGRLTGIYQLLVVPAGILLLRAGNEAARIPVGSPTAYLGKSTFSVEMDERDVMFAVSQFNCYQDRLARDLARFLSRKVGVPDLHDYVVPRSLAVIAWLPIGIGAVAMSGGAIGGALGGVVVGLLLATNLAIVRHEKWALSARLCASLGVSAFGYMLLALSLVGLARNAPADKPPAENPPAVSTHVAAKGPAERSNWGTAEDPEGDCHFEIHENAATIEVPGTIHNLVTVPTLTTAPRLLQRISGDFTIEVKVVDKVEPLGPAAPSANVAFNGAGLLLWADDGTFVRLERAAFIRDGNMNIYILNELHTPGVLAQSEGLRYPGGPVSVRIERRGETVFGSFSVDGTHWTSCLPRRFTSQPIKAGVAAVNTDSFPFLAHFEDLQIRTP